jgi:hypothetical protein
MHQNFEVTIPAGVAAENFAELTSFAHRTVPPVTPNARE